MRVPGSVSYYYRHISVTNNLAVPVTLVDASAEPREYSDGIFRLHDDFGLSGQAYFLWKVQ